MARVNRKAKKILITGMILGAAAGILLTFLAANSKMHDKNDEIKTVKAKYEKEAKSLKKQLKEAGYESVIVQAQKNHFQRVCTVELAHLEMICAIVYQLTKNMTMEELKASGFDKYYVDHTAALWPQAAGGIPFNACEFQSKGDIITDLHEDMAADGATA